LLRKRSRPPAEQERDEAALASWFASTSAITLAGLQERTLIAAEILGQEEQGDEEDIDQLMIRAATSQK